MWTDRRFEDLTRMLPIRFARKNEGEFGVAVPLRACPLGAHVDHQGGAVTGLALDRSVLMVAMPLNEPIFRLESIGFPGVVEVPLDRPLPAARGEWGDYARAAVNVLTAETDLNTGLHAVVQGELSGMGLSSSAAVLLAYLFGLAQTNGLNIEEAAMARLVQRAENHYIGLASGLLDQSIMLFAESGKLTHIRCRDFSVEQVAPPEPPPEFRVLVAFSGAPRLLVNTGYNERVAECREAARRLLKMAGTAPIAKPLLSDVDRGVFETMAAGLPDTLRRRADHYFGETERVREGVMAWVRGDLEAFGDRITASGESSIINFESGTPPLVTLYEALRGAPGVFGTRFSGAGFGGSCLALVAPEAAESVIAEVSKTYAASHPDFAPTAAFEICRPAGRARIVRPED